MEETHGSLYDYPKYYDLVYGSDSKAELDFLRACMQKHARRPVRRIFEPACGTGRLLVKLAETGFHVAGNDLSARAVDYCNARLARHGFPATAVVGDMSNFRLRRRVDAGFNMINSFRHLTSQRSALEHLGCVSRALAKGGIYVLGLHLTPTVGTPIDQESWSAQRGHLAIVSHMWTKRLNRRLRVETVGWMLKVYTPKRAFRLYDQFDFRTYTFRQFADLARGVEDLRVIATYDFAYDVNRPIKVGPETEDVVYVLLKV